MIKLFLILLSGSLFSCTLLIAQDEKKIEEKPTEISFTSAEFYNLQQAYRKDKKALFDPYKEKLISLLQKYITDAKQLYNEKKKSGNMKGMGVARKAKLTFSRALEELKEKDEFKLPKKVRKELRKKIAECRSEHKNILEGIDDKYVALEDQYRQKFKDTYKSFFEEGKAPEEGIIQEKFKDFLTTNIPQPKKDTQKPETLAELKEMGMEVPKKSNKPLSPIIASKGTGDQWIDIARWTGEMMGMDVVTISVLNKSKDFTETKYLPIADADSKLTYKAIRPMPANGTYSFRLKRVPATTDVDVMEWPSAGNDWSLVFRTRNARLNEEVPVKHAFIFQVSLPENELKKLFGKKISLDSNADKNIEGKKQTPKKRVPKVKVGIFSNPKGAKIYVNETLYRIKGKTLHTPYKIIIPAEKCNIKLALFGYKEKIYDDFNATAGAAIKAILEKDNSFKYFKKVILANAKSWTSTGISLKAGDEVIIQVEGIWCCTRSSKAKCGPKGIPNTPKNYKYYADAAKDVRQDTRIPYGALLMKLGENGTLKAIGKKTKFIAKEPVEIMFDINERKGKARKGNKGKLILKIAVKSE
jgi:hypothetical protein